MQHLVDVNILKHRQNSDGIHGRDETTEDHAVQDINTPPDPAHAVLGERVQRESDRHRVEQSAKDGVHEDRADVIKERPLREEVAGLQNDGREEEEEEDIGFEDVVFGVGEFAEEEDDSDKKTKDDEQRAFRENRR